jgi:hypothetical protein
MQTVKGLGDDAYTQLRFQLSQSNDWMETRGRIAWITASKLTAGVEFIDLSYESLIFIKKWISSIESPHSSQQENAIPPTKPVLTFDDVADVTSIPNTAKTDIVVEELVQELITEDLAAMLRPVTKDGRGTSENASGENECRKPAENVNPTSELEFTLYPRLKSNGPFANNDLQGVASKPRRYIGLLVGVLSVLISLGYSLRRAANGRLEKTATSSAKLLEAPSNSSTSSIILPRKPPTSSDAGFILQVAAMKDEKSAILLADLLHQKGFSGYVFKPAANVYYRVLVGPYSDAGSALKAEEELRKQGFEVIRKRNTPAQ